MRYVGQSYELTVDMDTKTAPDRGGCRLVPFASRSMYGHGNTAGPVEFVNLRTVHVHRPDERENPPMESAQSTAPQPLRIARPISTRGFVETPIFDRNA